MTVSSEHDTYLAVLRSHLPDVGDAVLTDDSLLEDLGLDSLGTVRLLADLEDTFGRELPEEALHESTFRTVDSLWQAFQREAKSVVD
ncbi:acyl carrier protein [Streptomyces sp. NPDC005209]|uniref:acyl carrier protein n=1 Tax=Streptomyces sp. NPDC005209 TaxID=3156715 RepID=UPI0033A9FF97